MTLLVISSLAVGLLLGPSTSAANSGIGVSPAEVHFDVARGEQTEENIVLLTSDTVHNVEVTVTGAIATWLRVIDSETGEDLSTDAALRNGRTRFTIHIETPSDAANGSYEAAISFATNTGAGVTPAIEVPVYVSVSGDQALAGRIVDAHLPGVAEVHTPYIVDLTLENQGNVAANVSAELEIEAANDATTEIAVDGGMLGPQSTRTVRLVWNPTDVGIGAASVRASAWLDETAIGSTSMSIEIIPVGSANRSVSLASLVLTGEPRVGGLATIRAAYESTAQVPVRIVFAGTLRRDGKDIEQIDSIEVAVAPAASGSLDVFVPVREDGHYALEGGWVIDGESGPTSVVAWQLGSTFPWAAGAVVALAVLLVALSALAALRSWTRSIPHPVSLRRVS